MAYRIRYTEPEIPDRTRYRPVLCQLLMSLGLGAALLLLRTQLPQWLKAAFLIPEEGALEVLARSWHQGATLRQSVVQWLQAILLGAGYAP